MPSPEAQALTLLKAAAVDAGAAHYAHGTPEMATLDDSLPFPQCQVFDLKEQQQKTESKVSSFPVSLYFVDAVKGDGDDIHEEEAVVSRMHQLKDRFIKELDRNMLVEITGLVTKPVHEKLQARASGVWLEFLLSVARTSDLVCAPAALPTKLGAPLPIVLV